MKAVVLVAGHGNRLSPLTNLIPKTLISVCGKPILQYILDDLIELGFNDICLVVGHLGQKIVDYFGDGSFLGIKITYVWQNTLNGTANALFLAKDFVKNDQFLIYLGDTLISKNSLDEISDMIKSPSNANLMSSKISNTKISSSGTLKINDDYVTSLSEKNNLSKSNVAWAGIAFFHNPNFFNFIEQLTLSHTGEYEITEAIELYIKSGYKVQNHTCEFFIDIGTVKGLLDFNHQILSSINTNDDGNFVFIEDNSLIDPSAEIGPYVSIDKSVIVSSHVKLKNSIVLENSNIPSKTNFSNTIIFSEGILKMEI